MLAGLLAYSATRRAGAMRAALAAALEIELHVQGEALAARIQKQI